MLKWTDIPGMYKGAAVIIVAVLSVVAYLGNYVTHVQADEQNQKVEKRLDKQQAYAQSRFQYILVLSFQKEKLAVIEKKAQAVADNNAAEAEKLEQEIQTIRDSIKGLCDQLDDC